MDLEEKITRRTFLKKGKILIGSLIASPFAGYGYARLVEPGMLEVTRLRLVFRRLPDRFAGKKILLFSDVHLDFHYGIDRLRHLVDRIQSLEPDILCFTGDLYDTSIGSSAGDCIALLRRLEAPLGKWAVLGNHDHTTGAIAVKRILTEGGFRVLINECAEMRLEDQRIQIAGVEDYFHGNSDIKAALYRADPRLFTLLLAHEPDLADEALTSPVDLQLSGHSHGGQVRIPFIGPVILPEMAKLYPSGLYRLGDGKLTLYTTRGVGLSTHPVRFMCPPELTLLTLSIDNS